jgi:hypothetical protein
MPASYCGRDDRDFVAVDSRQLNQEASGEHSALITRFHHRRDRKEQ